MQRQFRALALGRSALDTRTQTDVLESWFNDGMERVSGWYKRRIQLVTIVVAAGLTVLTNADTFHAASVLWENPTARAAFLEQARLSVLTPVATEPIQAGVPNFDTPAPETRRRTSAEFVTDASERETLLAASRELSGVRALGLGSFIGWSEVFHEFNDAFCAAEQEAVTAACRLEGSADEARCRALIDRLALDKRCHEDGANRLGTMAFPGWPLLGRPTILLRLAVAHVGGWFLTIVALSLGAPFWFDLLGRFVNIRSAGTKPA